MLFRISFGTLVFGLSLAFFTTSGAASEGPLDIRVVVDEVEHSRESYNELLTKNFDYSNGVWKVSDDGIAHIPYKYAQHTLGQVNKTAMKISFSEWEKNTCVRFKEMEPSDARKGNYLNIFIGTWCQANVGSMSWLATNVSMYPECGLPGYVHEMGHALGLRHTHLRSDRDKYLEINWKYVKPDRMKDLSPVKTVNFDSEFDYTSVMLYPPTSLSTVQGKLTMIPKNQLWGRRFGYYPRASFMDTKIVNRGLKCDKAFLKKCKLSADPCQNGGYMGPECKCICTPGSEGENCKDRKMSYQDAMLKKFKPNNKVFTTPGVVTTPDYPNLPAKPYSAMYLFRAPKCKKITITFLEDLFILDKDKQGKCAWDTLTISTSVASDHAQIYCDKDLKKGTVFNVPHNELIFELALIDPNGWPRKGFKVSWKYEDNPNCS